MSVLEICQLKVKDNISPSDSSIIASLQKVRTELKERVHPTNSRFFQTIEDPTLIYILGTWPSVAKHQTFLSSPEKPQILDAQQNLLDFNWMLHIPLDNMSSLPLDAPVVAIARAHVKGGEHVTAHKKITGKYRDKLDERTKPHKVVEGWRVDEEPGKQENVVITGWKSREDHLEFSAGLREKYADYAALNKHWEKVEAHHMRDMENNR
jgi:hypothetical protein